MGAEKVRDLKIIKDFQIKHHSYVDLIGLLKGLSVWFNSLGYTFLEKGIAEKDIGTGDQIESEWKAEKEVTEYIKYSIEIAIFAKDVRKVVLETGEEIYWGRVLIIINGTFSKDFQKKYNDKIWREELMRQIYERYFYANEIKGFIGKFAGECGDLTDTIKSYLK